MQMFSFLIILVNTIVVFTVNSLMKAPSITTVIDGKNKTLYMPVSIKLGKSIFILSV